MSSGIQLHPDVSQKYNEMKTKKEIPFMICRISDDLKTIEVERVGEGVDTFEDFRNHMIAASKDKKQGRYAVYDLVSDEDKQSKNKTGTLIFIVWISDNECALKQKMLYSSSKTAIKKALVGCMKEAQINDADDLTMEFLKEKAK